MPDPTDVSVPNQDAIDTGVSSETYNASKKEAEDLRAQIASLKARVEVSDSQKREQIQSMKEEVNAFVEKEVINCSFNEPYKQQLAPVAAYLKKIDEGEQVDTNLSIGRLVHCFSGTLKREREEFSKTKDAAGMLAEANKKIDEMTIERDGSRQRCLELEELVTERTVAAQAFRDELAKSGFNADKIDFSNKSARENTGDSGSMSVTATQVTASMGSAGSIDPHAALFDFMRSGPSNGGLKIGQSGTGHQYLGTSAPSEGNAIAAAMRGW
jgi:hypothetical protein